MSTGVDVEVATLVEKSGLKVPAEKLVTVPPLPVTVPVKLDWLTLRSPVPAVNVTPWLPDSVPSKTPEPLVPLTLSPLAPVTPSVPLLAVMVPKLDSDGVLI